MGCVRSACDDDERIHIFFQSHELTQLDALLGQIRYALFFAGVRGVQDPIAIDRTGMFIARGLDKIEHHVVHPIFLFFTVHVVVDGDVRDPHL